MIKKMDWGCYANKSVFLIRMENRTGAYVELTNYGATLVSAVVPDRTGLAGNTVLGFPNLQGYLADTCYIGATIGRYANRISGSTFQLDEYRYQLEANDGYHSNHGGIHGFNRRIFKTELKEDCVVFTLHSTDGEGGYPGNLHIEVSYSWNDNNELHICYTGVSDKKTVLNITNHAYFNLSGGTDQIDRHLLKIRANQVLETDAEYIPTGRYTPAIADFIVTDKLNHCYVLSHQRSDKLRWACSLSHIASGRSLEICTTYPALQVYSGDFLSSDWPGHGGKKYGSRDGLCLECQYFLDSPNQPTFPSTVLVPGGYYREEIVYKFKTIDF